MAKKVKILVLFYSFTGNTAKLAKYIAEGAEEISDTEVEIKQIPETLPKEVFEKNPEVKSVREDLDREYPFATVDDLVNADAVAFGSPTHFGSFAFQWKQFIDQLTPAWLGQKLINKPATFFCTAGSMHGGEEATLLSMMIPVLNLGMIPIGIPYPIQGEGPDFDSGSPYGAVAVSRGKAELSEGDKKVARILGRRLAAMAHILNCDNQKCQECKVMMQKVGK